MLIRLNVCLQKIQNHQTAFHQRRQDRSLDNTEDVVLPSHIFVSPDRFAIHDAVHVRRSQQPVTTLWQSGQRPHHHRKTAAVEYGDDISRLSASGTESDVASCGVEYSATVASCISWFPITTSGLILV